MDVARRLAKSNIRGGTQERDKAVDVLKGIAMILIVTGHAYTPHRDWIYLFHVAAFFMASGYCWHRKIDCPQEWVSFVTRQVKKLYVPYVIYNCGFTLLNNVFVRWNIYTDNTGLIDRQLVNAFPQQLMSVMSGKEMLNGIIKCLCLQYRPQMGGATWFISSLLLILILHATIELAFNQIIKSNNKIWLYCALLIVALIIPNVEAFQGILNHWEFVRLPYPYVAFLAGLILRKVRADRFYDIFSCAASFLALCALYIGGLRIEIASGEVGNPIGYVVASCSGWFFLMGLSKAIVQNSKMGSRVMEYIGTNTLPILYLHFLAFKLVSLLYVTFNSRPLYFVASFPVIFESSLLWRVVYIIVGVAVPLLLNKLISKIKSVSKKVLYAKGVA